MRLVFPLLHRLLFTMLFCQVTFELLGDEPLGAYRTIHIEQFGSESLWEALHTQPAADATFTERENNVVFKLPTLSIVVIVQVTSEVEAPLCFMHLAVVAEQAMSAPWLVRPLPSLVVVVILCFGPEYNYVRFIV